RLDGPDRSSDDRGDGRAAAHRPRARSRREAVPRRAARAAQPHARRARRRDPRRPGEGRADAVHDRRLQHRPRRPRPRARRRGRDDRQRALRAARAAPAGVRVARIRDLPPEDALETILAEVTSRTRLLALSHVSWLTGNLLPVEELKEATGLPMLVDGAQSAGAIPVEAGRFDFYTVSGQKWLCGPDS